MWYQNLSYEPKKAPCEVEGGTHNGLKGGSLPSFWFLMKHFVWENVRLGLLWNSWFKQRVNDCS